MFIFVAIFISFICELNSVLFKVDIFHFEVKTQKEEKKRKKRKKSNDADYLEMVDNEYIRGDEDYDPTADVPFQGQYSDTTPPRTRSKKY